MSKRLIINGHEVLIERDPDGWYRLVIDRADYASTLHQTEERAQAYAYAVCSENQRRAR